MKHHSGRFMDGSSFGFYDGYTRQYCPPAAKRFRHAKWNGMPEGAFVQNLPNPHGPNVGLQNQYQRGVAYGQQSGGDFSHQSVMHSSGGWADDDYTADQCMMFSSFDSRADRRPVKSGDFQRSDRPKSGSRISNQYTKKSTSDLQAGILEKLAAMGDMQANELARLLSCQKKEVNHVLYSMQREGVVDKVSAIPPRWALKCQLNTSAAHSVGTNSGSVQGSSVPATCSQHFSARSVVPLGVQAVNDASESYDIIPSVTVRHDAPPATGFHTFSRSHYGLIPPKTALNANSTSSRMQTVNDKQPSSGTSESYDIIPAVANVYKESPLLADVRMFPYPSCGVGLPKTTLKAEDTVLSLAENVCQQDITHAIVSSSSTNITNVSDAPVVSSVNASDIPACEILAVSGDSIQTVFSEIKKPAGRGRGILLLSAGKDRPRKVDNASSMPIASFEPKHDEVLLKDADAQFDSGIVPDYVNQLMLSNGANSPVFVDRITGVETNDVNKTNSHSDKILTPSCDVLRGPRMDHSSGLFKPPLPPKQLIRIDSTYKAAVDRDVNFFLKDNGSLLLRSQSQTDNAESDSCKSLSDSLNSLSFRGPSIPRTHSYDDLTTAFMPSHSAEHNPFAAALGIDDSPSVSALSFIQTPEAASGLSLTSESFAALNKNSVSALMEYGQSRHVTVEIQCIGSFGPPHRPVYVLSYKSLYCWSMHINIYFTAAFDFYFSSVLTLGLVSVM